MKGLWCVLAVAVAFTAFPGNRGDDEPSKDDREAKFLKRYVGYYSQTTKLSVLTRTRTAIFTCISATTTMAACTGRRRRALIEDIDLNAENFDEIEPSSLDASEGFQSGKVPVEVMNREGKKVTIWTSVFSTLEITTTIFNAGTTLTASAICNVVNGMTIGNSCFG